MCLAIPYKIAEIKENNRADIEVADKRQQVRLGLLSEVKRGDWVLVNLGVAVARIDASEAQEILNIYREMLEAETKIAQPPARV